VLVVSAGAIVFVVSVVAEELELLLHAANAPAIAKTINNFFICLFFL